MSDEFRPVFSEFAVGSQIAGYRLEEQIGHGGMAVVYRAYETRLDRNVALKILAPGLARDDAFRKRFIRESRIAAAVDHPNIIPVFDAGEADGVLFIAMRFVHGLDVRKLLDAGAPLPAGRATDIIAQVASALDAAHARGLVHRDVKPANMLLDTAAGGGHQDHVYLSDFGLGKQTLADLGQTGLTSHGEFLGTLDYVAPEQVQGRQVDGRADLYALACTAFELLCGAPPFKGSGQGLAVVWAKLSEPPPPLSARRTDLPGTVDDVMSRALAREPAGRFGNCSEFATALRDACGLGPAVPRSPGAAPSDPARTGVLGGAPGVAGSGGAGAGAGISGSGIGSTAAWDASGASGSAGPPTQAARSPVTRPGWGTKPGLTEPLTRGLTEPYDPAGRYTEPRPSGAGPLGSAGSVVLPAPSRQWWRSRAFMSAAAAVVVAGVVAAAFTALHHGTTGGGGSAGGLAGGLAVTPPGCTTKAASGPWLSQARSQTVALGGSPFGVAVTSDGKHAFVSLGNSIAVLSNSGGSLAPTSTGTIPAPGAAKTEAITGNGQYLLAVAADGAYVISVPKAEDGDGSRAVLGSLTGPPGNSSNELFVSPDGKFVFITFQNQGAVAVFDLPQAIAGGFGSSGYKGVIRLGRASEPQGMAESPDGRWLYVTGEGQNGRLYVISMRKAETDPQHAVHSSAAAGCAPARVIVSANGADVWVTDRDSNALVAFSAAKLLTDPSQSLTAQVRTGQKPIGLSFVNGGTQIMVADANTHGVSGADNIALVSTGLALQGGNGALLGFLSSGLVPRELALEPGGKTLLWTDNGSGQLQAIETGSLP